MDHKQILAELGHDLDSADDVVVELILPLRRDPVLGVISPPTYCTSNRLNQVALTSNLQQRAVEPG
jgi:hypothetical protein